MTSATAFAIGLYALTFGAPALHVLGEYLR